MKGIGKNSISSPGLCFVFIPFTLVLLRSLTNVPMNFRPKSLEKLAMVTHYGGRFAPSYRPNRNVHGCSPKDIHVQERSK